MTGISSNLKRSELLNMMCRICAIEYSNSIHIYGEEGKRLNIVKKIKACLPVNIREDDNLPKKICLTCLTKLDSCWEMYVLCKESQIKIEKKLHSLRVQGTMGQENLTPNHEDVDCGICNKEVKTSQMGVGCEGVCKKWHHVKCIDMQRDEYYKLMEDPKLSWICMNCSNKAPRPIIISCSVADTVEEKLRDLSEAYPVSYGSALICLAPEPPTPPAPAPAPVPAPAATVTRDAQVVPQAAVGRPAEPVMAPVAYLAPATTPVQPAAAPAEEIYPRALIKVPQNPVSEHMVVYQSPSVATPVATRTATPVAASPTVQRRRVVLPKPKAVPATTTPQRAASVSLKRKNGETADNINGKRPCMYCKLYFTDDIIDHHISLHLRQTFHTCLDCNKNFRSEEALERHRCESSKDEDEPINLDPDDEELIIV